jgi:hypothetical protein
MRAHPQNALRRGHLEPQKHSADSNGRYTELMLRRGAGVGDDRPASWQKRAAPLGTIRDTADTRRPGEVHCESASGLLPLRELCGGRLNRIQPERKFRQVVQTVVVKIEIIRCVAGVGAAKPAGRSDKRPKDLRFSFCPDGVQFSLPRHRFFHVSGPGVQIDDGLQRLLNADLFAFGNGVLSL